eukprot:jgi/Bigna1/84488/fgenesh1_pg.142_\
MGKVVEAKGGAMKHQNEEARVKAKAEMDVVNEAVGRASPKEGAAREGKSPTTAARGQAKKRKAANGGGRPVAKKTRHEAPAATSRRIQSSSATPVAGKRTTASTKRKVQTERQRQRQICYKILERKENKKAKASIVCLAKFGRYWKDDSPEGAKARKLVFNIASWVRNQENSELIPRFLEIAGIYLNKSLKAAAAPGSLTANVSFKSVYDQLKKKKKGAGEGDSDSNKNSTNAIQKPSPTPTTKPKKRKNNTSKAAAASAALSSPTTSSAGSSPLVNGATSNGVADDEKAQGDESDNSSSSESEAEAGEPVWATCPEKGLPCLCLGLNFVNEHAVRQKDNKHVVWRDRTRMLAMQKQGSFFFLLSLFSALCSFPPCSCFVFKLAGENSRWVSLGGCPRRAGAGAAAIDRGVI